MLAILVLFLGLGPAAPLAFAAGASATSAAPAAGPITVIRSTARSEFPKQLDFSVTAQSNAPIDSIRIAYQVGDDPVTSIAKVTFASGFHVSASYQIDLGQEYYPPGVTIRYRWLIQDQTGASLTSDWFTLKVSDPRFFWHERTLGPVTLHWYQGDDQFADAVLRAATRALGAADATVGVSSNRPVQVYLYANLSDFRSASGAGTEPWVGGQTYPLYRLVILTIPPGDVVDAQREVAHEMTHVAIDSTGEDPYGPLPTWLDEGIATVAEGPLDPSLAQALAAAVRSRRLLSIQAISGNFPESSDGAALAYAESASMVSYFRATYGEAKLSALIAAFRRGETPDEAFQQTIGLSAIEFQRRWEASLQRQLRSVATPSPAPVTSPPTRAPSFADLLSAPIAFILSLVESLLRLVQSTKG